MHRTDSTVSLIGGGPVVTRRLTFAVAHATCVANNHAANVASVLFTIDVTFQFGRNPSARLVRDIP